jgi:hypothetical protein
MEWRDCELGATVVSHSAGSSLSSSISLQLPLIVLTGPKSFFPIDDYRVITIINIRVCKMAGRPWWNHKVGSKDIFAWCQQRGKKLSG